MKVRRRTSTALDIGRLFAWFRPRAWLSALRGDGAGNNRWLDRVDSVAVEERPSSRYAPGTEPRSEAEPTPASGSGPPPVRPPVGADYPASKRWAERLKRFFRQWRQLVKKRPVPWILGGTFAGTAIAGYLFAALVMFPAPFIPSTVTVPSLVGMTEDEATDLLMARGLPMGDATYETHDRAPAGQVIWQEPPADARVSELTSVQLFVSNGPRRIPVPDVSGFENSFARRLIEAAGLTVGRVETVQTAVPRNVVVNTRPAPGATLLPGAELTLVVSVGAPTISVPDLAGLTREEAADTLDASGLVLGDYYRQTSSLYPAGTIIEQRPAAGTLIAPGTAVNVIIARSPQ